MNKKTLLILGFLIVCFGTAFMQFHGSVSPKKEISVQSFVIKQIITDGKKKISSDTKIASGSTALQLLNTTHKIVAKGEKENAFITAIDGRVADPQKKEFWAFYVNGKQAQVGAGSYIIKKNDTIEWKIETY